MSAYTFAELMRQHSEQWIIVVQPGGTFKASHRQAWPPVVFEDASPEALHEQLKTWEERRARQRRGGGE